ncbi:MAG TPA: hypothetical protein VKJ45_09000 [Blastocatellia bacterium]|nr:hypothetical protein [Blastocatellia bacterium]
MAKAIQLARARSANQSLPQPFTVFIVSLGKWSGGTAAPLPGLK